MEKLLVNGREYKLEVVPTGSDDMGHLGEYTYVVPRDEKELIEYFESHYEKSFDGTNESYFYKVDNSPRGLLKQKMRAIFDKKRV